jgi:hypothetical protein
MGFAVELAKLPREQKVGLASHVPAKQQPRQNISAFCTATAHLSSSAPALRCCPVALSPPWPPTSPPSPSCSRPAWTPARTSRVRRRSFCLPACCCPAVPLVACPPQHLDYYHHTHTITRSADTPQLSRPSPRSRPSPTSPSRSSTLSPPTRSPPQYGWPAPSTSRTSSSATGSTRMATTSCPRTRSPPSSAS